MACEQEQQDVVHQVAAVNVAIAAVNVANLTLNGTLSQLGVELGLLASKSARLAGCMQK